MISVAYAAEAAAAHGGESIFAEPELWVAVAFILFFVLVGKRLFGTLGEMLDRHSAAVRAEIEEATRLREEAQAMLTEFRRKQAEAAREAEAIVAHARDEATRAQEHARAVLETALARRREQALAKIARAEAEAVREVRDLAVQIAVRATRQVLAGAISGDRAATLVDQSIREIPARLH